MFMRPLMFTYPYFIAFWAVWLWAMTPEMRLMRTARKDAKSADSKDAGSVNVIFVVGQIGMLAGFVLAFVRFGAMTPRVPLFWFGVATLVAGSLLRRHCWRVLGEWFTGDVKARADQPVINRGAYRFVRHPSYTAGMLMFIGIGFAWGNWIGLACVFAATVAGYIYRVRVEERALSETIGEPYLAFMRTRKRFVPYVV
jgi:protein-S-isoprenylcysteine O-methyltransferase Ste14